MTVPMLTTLVPGAGPLQSQAYYVSLYLPVKFQATPPLPLPELNIKPYQFSSHCIAVRKFSGFAKDDRIVKEAQKLATSLSMSPWADSPSSQNLPAYSIAQYNTPFRIVNRRNEVWVDIHAPDLGCNSLGVAQYWYYHNLLCYLCFMCNYLCVYYQIMYILKHWLVCIIRDQTHLKISYMHVIMKSIANVFLSPLTRLNYQRLKQSRRQGKDGKRLSWEERK